ncbi:MAG TPA: hypothetical protein VM555_11600, partial [Tahibacter sp.]|nr:hypothetical protein [Tahibacter sp.]
MHRPFAPHPLCALLLALAATPACADWHYVEAQRTVAAPAEAFVIGRDSTVWTTGFSGLRRIDAAGNVTLTDGPQHSLDWTGDNYRFGATLPDGGIVIAELSNAFTRLDANGRLRWRNENDRATRVRANAAGDIWVVDGDGPARLRDDGTVANRIDGIAFEHLGPPRAITVDAVGSAIVATASITLKAARNGTLLWRQDSVGNVREILTTPDTGLTLVGDDEYRSTAVGALMVRRIDTQTGAQRWSRTVSG